MAHPGERGAHRIARRNAVPATRCETCTILTTAANETVAPVHGRMPVILPPEAYDPWLAGEDVAFAIHTWRTT